MPMQGHDRQAGRHTNVPAARTAGGGGRGQQHEDPLALPMHLHRNPGRKAAPLMCGMPWPALCVNCRTDNTFVFLTAGLAVASAVGYFILTKGV